MSHPEFLELNSAVRHEILVAADFNPPKSVQKTFKSRRDVIFKSFCGKIYRPYRTQNIFFLYGGLKPAATNISCLTALFNQILL